MQNTDIADLTALHDELARTNIAAVVGECTGTDPLNDPDMAAGISIAVALVGITKERNELTGECAFLRQQLAASEDRANQLEDTLGEAIQQRDYFRAAFNGLRESTEVAQRALERGHALTGQAYQERYRQERASAGLSPKDDMKPIPGFLTNNVTPIKHGRPVRG